MGEKEENDVAGKRDEVKYRGWEAMPYVVGMHAPADLGTFCCC